MDCLLTGAVEENYPGWVKTCVTLKKEPAFSDWFSNDILNGQDFL